jgi:hypothetical protein
VTGFVFIGLRARQRSRRRSLAGIPSGLSLFGGVFRFLLIGILRVGAVKGRHTGRSRKQQKRDERLPDGPTFHIRTETVHCAIGTPSTSSLSKKNAFLPEMPNRYSSEMQNNYPIRFSDAHCSKTCHCVAVFHSEALDENGLQLARKKLIKFHTRDCLRFMKKIFVFSMC